MKEFIDKLIGRLEKEQKEAQRDGSLSFAMGFKSAKLIVTQLAEEYKDKVIIDGQYCWQTCGATEHCKECNRLCNGSIDYFENYDFMAEEYKVSEMPTGWITDRVPTKEECGNYGKEFLTTILQGDKYKTVAMRYEYTTVRGKEVSRWMKYGRIAPWKPIAWCEMPAPFKEGE